MVISGKELSAKLKAEMAAEVAAFGAKYGRVPHLVVILVGEDPGSVSYVTGKAKASAEVGIRNTTIRKPESVCEAELLGIIADLNADEGVDGILVQLPLPKHIDEDKVIAAIDKEKDVDGFHPLNVAALWQKQPCTLPCTPKGILKMLRAAGVEIAGKEAVVIGRSNIVGLPVSKLLLDANELVLKAHPDYHIELIFEQEADDDRVLTVIGNPYLLTTAFVNLIENNCKYSDNRTSFIQISFCDQWTIVSLSDNGAGMSETDKENLFKLFYRGENKNQAQGHGIGMTLTKKILTLHKSEISVYSHQGEGTTFVVRFHHL